MIDIFGIKTFFDVLLILLPQNSDKFKCREGIRGGAIVTEENKSVDLLAKNENTEENDENSERELALSWIEGSDDAVDRVYKRYNAPIFRFVWMITRDQALTEDIVQEVFIRAFQKRHLLKEPYNIGSWMFTIARNITMRQIKKAKPPQEEQVEDQNELDQISAPNSNGSRSKLLRGIHLEKLKSVMSDAMEHLDPTAAEMVYLHYFENKTFQVIANELEVPLGTVCTKISRSLKALRKSIKRNGYHTRDCIWTRLSTAGF